MPASFNCLSLGHGPDRPPVNLFMRIDKSSFSDAARSGIDGDAGVRSAPNYVWT